MTVTRGQHLIGKVMGGCVLESLLGYGGSSAVFLAQEYDPERRVAVKVFLPKSTMDAHMQRDFYRRFLGEAEAASKLNHANILPIYSYGEEEGLPYIVMPYMPGGTLAEYMSTRGPLTLSEAQWYLEQIAAALDYAHEQNCVHCDVKPANILLDSQGYVMLSDFGIARLLQKNNDTDILVDKAVSDVVMGTPDYISPEQALGHQVDGRSDVYSLGVTLFFLLAKRLPFKADSSIALALMHVHESPPSMALIRADVTPAIDRILRKAMAKDPNERFQTAGDFSRAFANAVATYAKKPARSGKKALAAGSQTPQSSEDEASPSSAAPVVRVLPIKPARRKKSRIFLTLVACLVLLGSLAGVYLFAAHGFSPTGTRQSTATINPASIDQFTNTDEWPTSSTFFFTSPPLSYHVENKQADLGALITYNDHSFSNFRLKVTMEELSSTNSANDYYGIIFRASQDQSRYYFFGITGASSEYALFRYDNGQPSLAMHGTSSALLTGPGKQNTLTIEAHNNTFTFWINGQAIDKPFTDTAMHLTSGLIGLDVLNQGTEVAFSHLYITPHA